MFYLKVFEKFFAGINLVSQQKYRLSLRQAFCELVSADCTIVYVMVLRVEKVSSYKVGAKS